MVLQDANIWSKWRPRIFQSNLQLFFWPKWNYEVNYIKSEIAYGQKIRYIILSRSMAQPNKWHVHPAKTQMILGIRPVWSDSSLCAQWEAKDPCRQRRLWSSLGAHTTLLVLSCCGSYTCILGRFPSTPVRTVNNIYSWYKNHHHLVPFILNKD